MLAACGAETSRATQTASPTASPTDAPTVDARAYAIYDEDAGRQLASSNADDRLPVGSLMKLLNAHVAYRAGEPEQAVVAPDGLSGAADESVIGIDAGEAITRGVLIRAMLKVSANDAARLLALDIAGSEERYAEMMNDAAADLELGDTHAANATGLDADGQVSSANDLISLGTHLLRDATFRQTVSEPTANLNGETFANTNDLLGAYPGADGIKTGHTADAGWCILASATREGRRIVVVVLGAPTEAGRDDAAQTLLDWGFAPTVRSGVRDSTDADGLPRQAHGQASVPVHRRQPGPRLGSGEGRVGSRRRRRNHGRIHRRPGSLPDVTDDARTALEPTNRATLRRKRERGSHERGLINTILDEALVAHVGFVASHGPVVLPMTYVRIGDDLYLHGAAGNDMLRNLGRGGDVCVTVTLLDGLVFARSAFHHSMNYRCVVLFGRAVRVTGSAEMRAVAAGLVDHLAPGRSRDARLPTDEELRATLVVRLSILEGSAKVRTGGPLEEPDDLDLPVWAGEVPVRLVAARERPHSPNGTPPATPSYITNHALR